jgi:hypothetical protein
VSDIIFSVPANNSSAGHPTTQVSFFLRIPSAPSAITCLCDFALGSGDYFRVTLFTDRHVRAEFKLTGYGTASADMGAVPPNTWTWISSGFSTDSGLHVRGDMTPVGSGTTTASALASSGVYTGTTLTSVPFGIGVALTSSYASFPNDTSSPWLMSKLIVDQLTANAGAGNPRPMPTTDFPTAVAWGEYLAHDALGPATALADSGTNARDLPAGPQGLTIVTAGPALQPLIGGPTGPHEGDIAIFKDGAWINLHIGTAGQELTVVNGYPAWADAGGAEAGETIEQAGTAVGTRATINFTSGATVTDDPTNNRVNIAIAGSGGTVTSISFVAPLTFTVSGSPVTGSGTITLAWATQSAGQVLAGPASGSAAAPTFRGLVPLDVHLTTEGDLLYDHSGALTRLPVGITSGFALLSNTTDPYWGDAARDGPTRWEPVYDATGTPLSDQTGAPVMALVANTP